VTFVIIEYTYQTLQILWCSRSMPGLSCSWEGNLEIIPLPLIQCTGHRMELKREK